MRLQKWQIIVGIMGTGFTILWIIFQVFMALSSRGPDLVAFQQVNTILLPEGHLRFVEDMDMSRRGSILAIVEAASPVNPKGEGNYTSTLDTLKKFASTTVPVLGPMQSSVTTLQILNNGDKPATNVKVFLGGAGFVEIKRDGAAQRGEPTEGRVDLASLEPGGRCVVTFWGDRITFEEPRVVSDEGKVTIRPSLMQIGEYKWVIGLTVPDVVRAGTLLLCVAIFLLAVTFFLRRKPKTPAVVPSVNDGAGN